MDRSCILKQALYLTEAMKAIASMPPGRCLGALEILQLEIYTSRLGALALLKTKHHSACRATICKVAH